MTAIVNKKAQKTETKSVASAETVQWSFWLGLTFFFMVVVGMMSVGWLVSQRVIAEESAPVTSLVITGEMPYTKEKDILKAIDKINLGNFFNIDVNDVQRNIQALPWVYSVSVRKHWPSELKIYVVDQIPIASWNGDFFINQYGTAFQADAARVDTLLPAFYGPEGSELIALENFINFNKLLEFNALAIDELVLSERFSWQITLNDGVRLNLGREERVERIQRFLDVYQTIKAEQNDNQRIDYVDLRYDTGVAVGWKSAQQKERV